MRGPDRRRLPALVLIAAAVVVVALFFVLAARGEGSGAVRRDVAEPRARAAVALPGGRVGRCPNARRGHRYYSRRVAERRFQLGAEAWHAAPTPRGCARARRAAYLLRARARQLRRHFEAWYAEAYARFRCVHEHEGSWTDPNPTYYGGLQMDVDFMRAHGPEYLRRWGTADRWPIWAQLRAGERALATRGWSPWPNTARTCGLL